MPLEISIVIKDVFVAHTATLRSVLAATLDPGSSALRVIDSIKAATEESEGGDQYIVGVKEDGVAALMIVSGGMSKKIDELVAKPGNGIPMVEFAMNVCKGRALLDSFDTASTVFWAKVGFIKYEELPTQADQGGCRMRLICSVSEKWASTPEGWRLVRAAVAALPLGARAPQPYSGLGVGRREKIY
jgi:hypothetical protein